MPAWYTGQLASEDPFYTPLNYKGEYVASKGTSLAIDQHMMPLATGGERRHRQLPSQGINQSNPNTSHSTAPPDLALLKRGIDSIELVTMHSLSLLITRKSTRPKPTERPSIPIAGRPVRTTSSHSAKPTSHHPSVRRNQRTAAFSTAMTWYLPPGGCFRYPVHPARPCHCTGPAPVRGRLARRHRMPNPSELLPP